MRYGNVIGSRGSVIPYFLKRFKDDKILTVTDPKMTRFNINLNQAVNLVYNSLKYSNSGNFCAENSKF